MRADLIMAWLQQQLARERPDTFAQTVLVRRYEACKSGVDHTFFSTASPSAPSSNFSFPERWFAVCQIDLLDWFSV